MIVAETHPIMQKSYSYEKPILRENQEIENFLFLVLSGNAIMLQHLCIHFCSCSVKWSLTRVKGDSFLREIVF